jgi:hypothetical protein
VERRHWLLQRVQPAQAVLTVDQIMWTHNVTKWAGRAGRARVWGAHLADARARRALMAMEGDKQSRAMKDVLSFSQRQIAAMVDMVRGPLTSLQRQMMVGAAHISVRAQR